MDAVFLTFILMLSIFLGFELINKVPATLHTPLMSGANAISGITVVGAIALAGTGKHDLANWLGAGAVALASINVAAVQLSDIRIYLFDNTGLLNSRLSYSIGSWEGNGDAPTTPIGTYTVDQSDGDNIFLVNSSFGDSGNFQFAGQGFEASCRVGSANFAFFAKPGQEYALYSTTNGGIWQNPLESLTWFNNLPNENNQMLFEKVGAASFIEFGGSSGRWYLINETGDEIMEYLSSPTRKFNGPWVIN